jgi:excisionase family DNA binding protein
MAEVFLTVEQAAGRLHIAPYTLREWIKRGKVRSFKPGRAWLIPEKALDELAAGGSTTRAGDNPLADALSLARARDARMAAQGKPQQTFDVAEELNAMRDGRLRELSGE